MKRLIAGAAAILLIAGVLSTATAVSQPAQAAIGSVTTVYTLPASTSQSLRAPAIGAFDASNIVTGWRNQPNGSGMQDDAGSVLIARSTNGGTSWGTPTVVKARDAHYGYVNITFYRDPASSTMYAYIGQIDFTTSPPQKANDMRLIAMKSTDDGATWSDVALTLGYSGVTITGGQVYKTGSTYLMPFHDGTQHGVLKSTDLTTWSLAAVIASPSGLLLQEGSIATSVDDSSKLILMMRVNAYHAYSSTSSDGGNTWSAAVEELNVPSTGTKGYFGLSAYGPQIAITGNAALKRRDAITYQVRYAGDVWGPKRFVADDQNQTVTGDGVTGGDGTYPDWDTYPNAIEISAGHYLVVWETGTTKIRVAPLDLTTDSDGASTAFVGLTGWHTTNAGAAAISPASQLQLLSNTGAISSAYVERGPVGGFRLQARLKVDSFTANDPTAGVSAGMKVATGSHRLMMAVQGDGVYAITSASSPGWTKVYAATQDSSFHTWRVDVDGSNVASLTKDGGVVLTTWTLQSSSAAKRIETWTQGTSTLPAQSHFDNLYVNTLSVDEGWNNTTGWRLINDGNTIENVPTSQLHLTSTNGNLTEVAQIVAPRSPFTVQFESKVTNYTANAPATGVSFGTKVDTGRVRLMLAMQGDGVYALTSTSGTSWVKVYSAVGDNAFHTWRVEVDALDGATLYKDGTAVSSPWTLPASLWVASSSKGGGVVEHWVDGTPTDDSVAYVNNTMVR